MPNSLTTKAKSLKDRNPVLARQIIDKNPRGPHPSTTINNNNIVININKNYSVIYSDFHHLE